MIKLFISSALVLLHTMVGFSQGLVLKHVHSSTTHQQQFFAQNLDGFNSVVRYGAWDFNGDGEQDYLVQERPVGGGPYWNLKVYDAVGFGLLWLSEGEIPSETTWGTPRFYDFTGDGQKEIVYIDPGGTGSLYIYSPILHECILSANPASDDYLVLDFDADGVLDIGLYSSIAPEEYRYEIWGAGQAASSPPSDLVIQASGTDLILNWQPVDSCSLYDVQWSFTLDGDYASVGTCCTTSFRHPGAAIAPRAYYRVAAITSTFGQQVVGQATYVIAK